MYEGLLDCSSPQVVPAGTYCPVLYSSSLSSVTLFFPHLINISLFLFYFHLTVRGWGWCFRDVFFPEEENTNIRNTEDAV